MTELRNNMRNGIILMLVSFWGLAVKAGEDFRLTSPDGRIEVKIMLKDKLYYQASFDGIRFLDPSPLSMEIDEIKIGQSPELMDLKRRSVNQTLQQLWGSRKEIKDIFNELTLNCKNDYSVIFRVYDNGIAYRFATDFNKEQVTVWNEEVAYRFGFGTCAWMMNEESYESVYQYVSLDAEEITDFNNKNDKIFLPVIVQATDHIKVAISEAGLRDYPSLFLSRGNDYENYLLGRFEKYALTTGRGGFSNYTEVADQQAAYIALTSGTRKYPWRLLIVADQDKDLADCDLVYQLSDPSEISSDDWIRPGKAAWEWWNDYVVEGKDFVGGVNTETYFYYIDFAEKYGLEYILVDWLWTDKYDLTLFNPDVDIQRVIEYGREKGVGVFLWCPGHTLYRQLEEALDLFTEIGAVGIKADFFGKEDQTGINMYEEIARAAAMRRLMVDFHGCTKPTGLSRTFPNVINYEAVAGNEYNKLEDKCTGAHKVILPFTRAIQGPMDFTPGGMRNRVSDYAIFFTLPLVHGTRSNEMALYVIYNEPLKMLCDAPSVYEKEPDLTRFIASIPTTWDQTEIIHARFGEFIVMAKKSGSNWYLAGITSKAKANMEIPLSFLGEGEYSAQILTDGANAGRVGTDYNLQRRKTSSDMNLKFDMAENGGFLASFKPIK